MTKSPDEAVSEAIVAAFRERKLVPENQLERLTQRILHGSLRVYDWRSLAEPDVRGEEENAAKD